MAENPDAFGSTLASWSDHGDTETRWRARLSEVPLNVVAVANDIAVGQASGTVVGDDGTAEVISMWVAPEARGTGVAETLLRAVEAWASSEGASALVLSVKRENDRAVRCYHRAGFCRTAEPSADATEALMIKLLASGADSASFDEDCRRQLLAMVECDQIAARASYEASQRHEPHRNRFLFDIPSDEWLPEYWTAKRTIDVHTARFRDLIELVGWPPSSSVGDDGARAAWLLAQHAGEADKEFQASLVPLLAAAVENAEANPEHLAALADRVELEAGRLQIYGTHLEPRGESWAALRGVAQPDELDVRRARLGLKPWAEYLDDCLNGRFSP